MKTIIKLLITAAILHATWKGGSTYLRFWQFKEEVTEIAQFGVNQSNETLRGRVLDSARRRDIPINANTLSVQRRQARIIIDGSYVEQVELVPRYFYPWEAKLHVDVLTLVLQEAR
jgi:hypothetical protein